MPAGRRLTEVASTCDSIFAILQLFSRCLVGSLARLTLVLRALRLFRYVLLGSAPDPKIQAEFQALSDQHRGENAAFVFDFNESLSHLIYAAADFVLVPSTLDDVVEKLVHAREQLAWLRANVPATPDELPPDAANEIHVGRVVQNAPRRAGAPGA